MFKEGNATIISGYLHTGRPFMLFSAMLTFMKFLC